MAERLTSVSLAPDAAAGRVELERADLEHRRALDRAATGERAQAREQLGERERLGQVVVGAAVQAGDAVLDGVARGEHDHRRPDALLTQATARLEAVDAREHHVQHDRVIARRPGHPEGILALDGHIRRQALPSADRAGSGSPS